MQEISFCLGSVTAGARVSAGKACFLLFFDSRTRTSNPAGSHSLDPTTSEPQTVPSPEPLNTGVGCVKVKYRVSSLKLCFCEFFFQDLIFGSLWLLARFYVVYVVGPGRNGNHKNLMAVDDQSGGSAYSYRVYLGAQGSFPL